MSHRLVIPVAAAAATIAIVVAAHASASPQLGRSIVWSSPAAAVSGPPSASSIPTASAPPTVDAGPLAGLRGPISGLFNRLNASARSSAGGQYSILQQLSATLRQWLEGLLGGITGRR